jgi:adenine deaminase
MKILEPEDETQSSVEQHLELVTHGEIESTVNHRTIVAGKRSNILIPLLALSVVVGLLVVATVCAVFFGRSSSSKYIVSGWVVDIYRNETFPGVIIIDDGHILKIERVTHEVPKQFILPGFVDSHVHVESSLLIPSEFSRLAVRHGTVATVSDPHEIANVLGVEGINFMLENAETVPFHFFFGAPSCVPATPFETAGSSITLDDIEQLFHDDRIKFLSEMMNYPGVLNDDPIVLDKIKAALDTGRVVDGHAPGLKGDQARIYASHGITTDHECYMLDEAQDKIKYGMKIQIRYGSAAQNFGVLHPIIGQCPDKAMFCTDDSHPDFLKDREIDYHVRESIKLGYNLFDVLRIASKNPVQHYQLPVGLLREGDSADFIIVDNLSDFNVLETWIMGEKVFQNGTSLLESIAPTLTPNKFAARVIDVTDIARNDTGRQVRVIVAEDGMLVTKEEIHLRDDIDVLKLVVLNRYEDHAVPAVAYIKGFNFQRGAIASSVAHDSHNVIAVGWTDEDIVNAINAVIQSKGGLAVSNMGQTDVLPLPIAGLMSSEDGFAVAERYSHLNLLAKELGTTFRAPFMTLSFMALLVIPALKLSDQGLFDGTNFTFVDLYV